MREFVPSNGWGGAICVYLAVLPLGGMVAMTRIGLEIREVMELYEGLRL